MDPANDFKEILKECVAQDNNLQVVIQSREKKQIKSIDLNSNLRTLKEATKKHLENLFDRRMCRMEIISKQNYLYCQKKNMLKTKANLRSALNNLTNELFKSTKIFTYSSRKSCEKMAELNGTFSVDFLKELYVTENKTLSESYDKDMQLTKDMARLTALHQQNQNNIMTKPIKVKYDNLQVSQKCLSRKITDINSNILSLEKQKEHLQLILK